MLKKVLLNMISLQYKILWLVYKVKNLSKEMAEPSYSKKHSRCSQQEHSLILPGLLLFSFSLGEILFFFPQAEVTSLQTLELVLWDPSTFISMCLPSVICFPARMALPSQDDTCLDSFAPPCICVVGLITWLHASKCIFAASISRSSWVVKDGVSRILVLGYSSNMLPSWSLLWDSGILSSSISGFY